jgi:CRISPR-associated protein Csm1
MNNNSKVVLLAGLLHDIGKFFQRADEGLNDPGNQLSSISRNILPYICPKTQDGYYGYQHSVWTHEFLHRNEKVFKKADLFEADISGENIITLASYHHKPSSELQSIVQMADWWSSGFDRSSEENYATDVSWGKKKYKAVPLSPLFQNLHINGKGPQKIKEYSYPLSSLTLDKNSFPLPIESPSSLENAYKQIWNQFNDEFSSITTNDPNGFVFTLYHLLKKHTRTIPASTKDYPDSSLFEHLKITAAIAHCLYEYKQFNGSAFLYDDQKHRTDIQDGIYPLCLFCGDISGIQNFIYQISSRYAAKSLKGRSFYLQMLAESLTIGLLHVTGYSICNQVYTAGGKFYLLLPNVPHVLEKANSYLKDVNRQLWELFDGQISINYDHVAFSYIRNSGSKPSIATNETGYERVHIGELWRLLAEKTSLKKGRKYEHFLLDSDNYSRLFEPFGAGGNEKICAVTGRELSKGNTKKIEREDDEDELVVDTEVYRQVEIGEALYQHTYTILSAKPLVAKNVFGYPSPDGSTISIAGNNELTSVDDALILKTVHNDAGFLSSVKGNNNGYGFRLYGGSSMAQVRLNGDKSRGKTFEELGGEGAFKRIGILRMDVDNLGQLFMNGVPEASRSFSTLATLSEQLDFFFSGYLNTIRNTEVFCNWVNIIYSGGDDVFAVGRWDKIIEFAHEVREAFRKWVCDRDDITLSAGIAIVRPKFPIAKAASLAGDAEDEAKSYVFEKDGLRFDKNAINLFGISANWTHEFPFVNQFRKDLMEWILERQIFSKGLLMKLFDYYILYQKNMPDWKWQAAYALARMKNNNKATNDAVEALKILLFSGSYKQFLNVRFEAVIMACRWAELEMRSKL